MNVQDNATPRVINHKTMRIVIGLIALMITLVPVLLSGKPVLEMSSISISYWTDSRDIFVGSLIAVAFFLSAYNGTGTCGRDMEYWLSKIAGTSAILVALFPTTDFNGCEDCAASWIIAVSKTIFTKPHVIHNTSAIILFICLFLLMSLFSDRARNKGEINRARFYRGLSLGMLFGMITVGLIGKSTGWYHPVIAVEGWGLIFFGLGWLQAGFYTTKVIEKVPAGAIKIYESSIDPAEKLASTGVEVEPGVEYIFRAEGCWKDWFMECGPDGWGPKWNPLAFFNRLRWEPFLKLCGSVGEDKIYLFPVGSRSTWSIEQKEHKKFNDPKLYLFANDWDSRYENNQSLKPERGGPLKVTIYRLP